VLAAPRFGAGVSIHRATRLGTGLIEAEVSACLGVSIESLHTGTKVTANHLKAKGKAAAPRAGGIIAAAGEAW
jgi:hypothetical protein